MEDAHPGFWRRCHAGLFGVGAILFWVVPFFVSGWSGRSWQWLPRTVSFQHTAAGLFTQRTEVWWDHHIEAEGLDGRRFEMPEHALFPTGAFGYRSKFDRIMNESARSRLVKRIRLRLAEHVFKRWIELGMEPRQLKAVRFIRSLWQTGGMEMAHPSGHWNPPPVTALPQARKVLLGGYHLADGRVRPFWQEGDPLVRPSSAQPPGSFKAPRRRLSK